MADLRTAAQQALDYWEQVAWGDAVMADKMDALRAALAQQAEPVEPVESALQAVAEKIGDQCAVWYGIGARDVEAVLREAARYGLVHGAQAEPVEPAAWVGDPSTQDYASTVPDPQIADRLARHGIPMPGDPK